MIIVWIKGKKQQELSEMSQQTKAFLLQIGT